MANRSDNAKLRKSRNRNRYARFSGATSRIGERIEQRLLRDGDVDEFGNKAKLTEDETKIKEVHIYVGKVSLTRQVVNGTKSSVNAERMETYFSRIRTKDQPLTVAEVFGVRDSPYQKIWDETPTTNRLNLYSNELGRLDMYCQGRTYFFVEVDTIESVIKRSRDYGSPDRAKKAAQYGRILWEEVIPIP